MIVLVYLRYTLLNILFILFIIYIVNLPELIAWILFIPIELIIINAIAFGNKFKNRTPKEAKLMLEYYSTARRRR